MPVRKAKFTSGPTPATIAKALTTDRREAITDAAIEILADIGSRGLTHRAVDSRLKLATGSTSYYFRTREALLTAAAHRLLELDQRDTAVALTVDRSAIRLLEQWLAPKQRARLIARFELYVASSRRASDQPAFSGRTTFVTNLTNLFAQAGVPDARLAAVTLIAMMDGLLLNELLGTGLKPAERARVLDTMLAAIIRTRGESRAPKRESS